MGPRINKGKSDRGTRTQGKTLFRKGRLPQTMRRKDEVGVGEQLAGRAKEGPIYGARALRGWEGVDLSAGVEELAWAGRKSHSLWERTEADTGKYIDEG